MSSPFTGLLASLIRHRGVTGCMVVGEADGMVVDSSLQIGVNGEAIEEMVRNHILALRNSGEVIGTVPLLELIQELHHA